MPVFVSLGRYSQNAIKAMLAKPEDRTAAVRELVERAGGKLLGYYVLFGEWDYVTISELPGGQEAAAAVLAATGAGASSDSVTMLAMTGAEAKAAFEAGRALGASYQAPGAS